MSPTNEKGVKKTSKRGLKKKLVLSMLLVGALPLLVGLALALFQGTQEIQEVNGTSFQALATETARKLDLVLTEEISKTTRITTHVDIVAVLEQRRDALDALSPNEIKQLISAETQAWNEAQPQMVRTITKGALSEILNRHGRRSLHELETPIPIVTRSSTLALFVTDIAGRLVTSINDQVQYTHANEAWWQGAYNKGVGQGYLSNVAFDQTLNTYTFTLSLPIMDSLRYQVTGVLHRVFDAKEFFSPSLTPIRFGETGHVMLIDGNGIVMSCPILPTGVRLANAEIIPLVTHAEAGWVAAPSDGHGGQDTSIIGFAPLPGISRITNASTGLAWHMFVWQSSEELFAPIQNLFTRVAGFGLLAILLLTTLGFIAAERIVTPIRKLQEAAGLIGRGALKDPIAIHTNDEIEELAEAVNRMNQQLQVAFAGLTSEVELKRQEVQYLQESTDQILGNVPDPVVVLDQDWHVQYMNAASKRAFHLETHEVEGSPFLDLLTLDDTTQQRLQQTIQSIEQSQDQHERPTSSTTSDQKLYDPMDPKPLTETTAHGKRLDIHNRIYQYECFLIQARPGEQTRIGLALRDTTDESRLHDQLTQSEKMASLGILSAGIGHELNNPLVGVIGFGEAILEEQDPAHIKEHARNIVERGQRMAAIIQDFTGHARGGEPTRRTQTDINEQLEHAINTVQSTHESSKFEVQKDLHAIPVISAKPDELRQAFMNILTNSVQALQGHGVLSLSTAVVDEVIQIHIRDNGPGISKAYLTKVFDPFFTTKRQGEGSGLGLTIARRIVNRYGGQIQITNEEGHGTDCLITFPIHPSPEDSAK